MLKRLRCKLRGFHNNSVDMKIENVTRYKCNDCKKKTIIKGREKSNVSVYQTFHM